MRRMPFIAAAMGAASGLIFLSGLTGQPLFIFLAFLAQIPIYVAGLGWRWPAALGAGAVGALASFLAAGLPLAFFYFLFVVLPPVLITRAALWWRGDAGDDGEWYPPGRLLLWLAGVGAGIPMFLLVIASMAQGSTDAVVSTFVADLMAREEVAPQVETLRQQLSPPGEVLSNEDLAVLIGQIAPIVTCLFWTVISGFSGLMAHWAMVRSGRSVRPAIDPASVHLPRIYLVIAAGMLLAPLVLPGLLGLAASFPATVALIPYFFLGLAVVHDISRAWPARGATLALFYLLLAFFPIIATAPTILGLTEQVIELRRRIRRRT